MEELLNKKILITGGAYRLGKVMALAAARAGADVILHHGHSPELALETAEEIRSLGRECWIHQADLGSVIDIKRLIEEAFAHSPVFCLVNNASIFPSGGMMDTELSVWQNCIDVNLTSAFMLSQAFIRSHVSGTHGRIINLLDWRAIRPGRDHVAYTISKSALASLTQATAIAAAPEISVNALALGAILPPVNEPKNENILSQVPLKRWAKIEEFVETFLFLLQGPSYVNGEIIHLDGGRHLI
jgi:NAD(P)-dependent dehydrogenase (short-subunit alcohol dehydrogenase family)